MERAIALHRTIEELRLAGETRRLSLKEKLALMGAWDELKQIVCEPAGPARGAAKAE